MSQDQQPRQYSHPDEMFLFVVAMAQRFFGSVRALQAYQHMLEFQRLVQEAVPSSDDNIDLNYMEQHMASADENWIQLYVVVETLYM